MQQVVLKVALVPFHEYEELLKRSQFAPKVLPVLSGKQKRRVNDKLEEATVCHMTRDNIGEQPATVQEFVAQTVLK